MDQDSFRQLLSSGPSQTHSQPRESLFTKKKNTSKSSTKPATISSSEPAFKPRKVKKAEGRYRDRAAERRVGEGNDYAQVEAVLEEFEKRTADQDEHVIDEQRRYLGGDGEHSILVKGLDMALLQQNKAKAATATDEDESLEQAYTQSASEPIVSSTKKRTREEIIRELKEQRAQRGESNLVEDPTLNKNKFKPIGFKPIGGSVEQKKNKKKVKGDGERKKKRRKVELSAEDKSAKSMATVEPTSTTSTVPKSPRLLELEELQPPEEFDIFAGVGDYEGLNDDDDDESEGEGEEKEKTEEVISRSLRPGQWFVTDEQTEKSPGIADESPLGPTPGPSVSHPPPIEEAQASDEEQLTRLVPLSSSAVPSIKELLAIDEAAEAADKKHKRKNKKRGGDGAGSKKLDAEAKANRDYQRLKSYTDKRGDE